MGRRTQPLTSTGLATLPEPGRTCVTWLLSAVQARDLDPAQREAARREWVETVTSQWGTCGQVLHDHDDEVVGHVMYAPAAYLPGLASLPTAPAGADAVVMVELAAVLPDPPAAVARHLVQAMAKDLVEREVAAVEAFAQVGRGPRCTCGHDPALLGAVGFTLQRAHPAHPRYRMDLRKSLTWKDEFELALERVVGAVRPSPSTPKATRSIRSARVASASVEPSRLR
mgnify:CR=1 FL=1